MISCWLSVDLWDHRLPPGEGVISSIGVDGLGYKEFKTGPGLLGSFTRTENMLFWVTLDKGVCISQKSGTTE